MNLQEPSGPHYSTLPRDTEVRLQPGAIVAAGRLEVIEELGRGGMAIVYRARDRAAGGREVALKVVTAQADHSNTEARYRNEARLGGSLAGHPHLVRALEVGSLDGPLGFEGRMFLVNELVVGVSLDHVMVEHRTGLPLPRACAIACGVARALVGLHERGIIHRDIKPSNVILSGQAGDQGARLIDFGLAYATGDGWEPKSPDLTENGRAPGTPLYMSPQQAAHQRPAPGFDIYSFGVMLYELVSGNPPYEGLPLGVLLARKCDPQSRPFPIDKMCSELPPALTTLVDRCLAHDPTVRPTAEQIVRILEGGASGLHKPPSVIADGARPAGDLTRVDLRRKAIPLPFVARAAEQASNDGPGAVPPPVQRQPAPVVAAPAIVPPARVPVVVPTPDPVTTGAGRLPASTPTETKKSDRRWWIGLLPVLLLIAVGIGAFMDWRVARVPTVSQGTSLDTTEAPEPVSRGTAKATVPPVPNREVTSAEHPPSPAASTPNPDEITDPPSQIPTSARSEDARPHRSQPKARPRRSERPDPGADIEPPTLREPSCADKRQQATDAKARGKWAVVLTQTKDASCWTSARRDRDRLRVEALLRLRRYKACASEASASKDPMVVRWREDCFRYTITGTNPAPADTAKTSG
ncbi:MAG: protein kinase [Deltaproteobacteria bacterium]|nr:protein kinase [Deltaproteobacteria bacterium]